MFNIFWYFYHQHIFPTCFQWHNAYSLLLTYDITVCFYNASGKLCSLISKALAVRCEGNSDLVFCHYKLESNIHLVVNIRFYYINKLVIL